MKIRLLADKAVPARSELLVCLAFEGARPKLPTALDGTAKKARATGDLKGGFRKFSLFYPGTSGGPKRLAFVGLGARKDLTTERLRQAAAVAQAQAEELGVGEFQLRVAPDDYKGIDALSAGAALAEGLVLGAYRYQPASKKKPEPRKGQRAGLLHVGAAKAFGDGVKLGVSGAEGAVFARDLGNKPGNECTPKYLAAQARKLASPGLRVKVLTEADMARLKMGRSARRLAR